MVEHQLGKQTQLLAAAGRPNAPLVARQVVAGGLEPPDEPDFEHPLAGGIEVHTAELGQQIAQPSKLIRRKQPRRQIIGPGRPDIVCCWYLAVVCHRTALPDWNTLGRPAPAISATSRSAMRDAGST